MRRFNEGFGLSFMTFSDLLRGIAISPLMKLYTNNLRFANFYKYNHKRTQKERDMKKFIAIIAALVITPAIANEYGTLDEYTDSDYDYQYSETYVAPVASAQPAPKPRRDNYVGIRLHNNAKIAYDYDIRDGGNMTLKDDNFGFGLMIGNRLTDHVKIEFETAYTGAKFNKYATDFDYDIWSNMLNVYLFQEYAGAVAPYFGLGIGFAGMWGDVSTSLLHTSDNSFDLSYQAMIGVNFALNDRIDLNLGFKYQRYGEIEHKSSAGTYATTDIDATEIFISVAYKFGL